MVQTVPNRFIEIGRIGKPRGLDGTVRFLPNNYFIDGLFDKEDLFYIRNERSDFVPVRLNYVQLEVKRNHQTFFVQFDLIANRDDAEAAVDKALFAEKSIVDELTPDIESDTSDGPDFADYDVTYNGSLFGTVLDVMENPAHLILEVKYEGGVILIPFVDEFIESTHEQDKTISCINLDQLLEE